MNVTNRLIKTASVTQLTNSIQFLLLVILLFCLLMKDVEAAKNSRGGFIDLNYYPILQDVKNDSVVSINVAAKLPHRLSYFSLLNLSGQGESHTAKDTNGYYTEQNLQWQVTPNSPIDLTFQLNMRGGESNDRYRLGFRWRAHNTKTLESFFKGLNLSYSVNVHALQIDHDDAYVWQLEHVFYLRFPYISNNLYLSGFADHTFNETLPDVMPSNPVVAEVQLGYQLLENFYVTSEYRWNEYRTDAVNNLSFGVQYKISW